MRRLVCTYLIAAVLLVNGCGTPSASQPSATPGQSQAAASILADPNPVPTGPGLGTTTITWKTGDGSQAQVYVSQDGGTENLFDAGTGGSKEAPWIQTGSIYVFGLYAGSDHRTQLGSVKV